MVKRKLGAGRKNEVGDDISSPVRVPKTLIPSVKALVRLHRARGGCPQLYAAVAMYSIYQVFGDKLDSLPTWEPYQTDIRRYLNRLQDEVFTYRTSIKRWKNKLAVADSYVDELDDLIALMDDTFSEVTLYRTLSNKLPLIEEIEKRLREHYAPR